MNHPRQAPEMAADACKPVPPAPYSLQPPARQRSSEGLTEYGFGVSWDRAGRTKSKTGNGSAAIVRTWVPPTSSGSDRLKTGHGKGRFLLGRLRFVGMDDPKACFPAHHQSHIDSAARGATGAYARNGQAARLQSAQRGQRPRTEQDPRGRPVTVSADAFQGDNSPNRPGPLSRHGGDQGGDASVRIARGQKRGRTDPEGVTLRVESNPRFFPIGARRRGGLATYCSAAPCEAGLTVGRSHPQGREDFRCDLCPREKRPCGEQCRKIGPFRKVERPPCEGCDRCYVPCPYGGPFYFHLHPWAARRRGLPSSRRHADTSSENLVCPKQGKARAKSRSSARPAAGSRGMHKLQGPSGQRKGPVDSRVCPASEAANGIREAGPHTSPQSNGCQGAQEERAAPPSKRMQALCSRRQLGSRLYSSFFRKFPVFPAFRVGACRERRRNCGPLQLSKAVICKHSNPGGLCQLPSQVTARGFPLV